MFYIVFRVIKIIKAVGCQSVWRPHEYPCMDHHHGWRDGGWDGGQVSPAAGGAQRGHLPHQGDAQHCHGQGRQGGDGGGAKTENIFKKCIKNIFS